jgi:hypothetical protein
MSYRETDCWESEGYVRLPGDPDMSVEMAKLAKRAWELYYAERPNACSVA